MNWINHGLFLKPSGNWWDLTHAMVPTPYKLDNGNYRIYYSGRNSNNQSHIAWAEISLDEKCSVIRYSEKPVLAPGSLGCFDDNGVTPSCILPLSDKTLALYYIGWNPGSTVRMHLYGGLALSEDNGISFKRYSKAPILERCLADPYLNTAPWVIKVPNGFRIYYVSGVEWIHKDLPKYNIKTAFSSDGFIFDRRGEVCIDFKSDDEVALARPYVIFDDDIWKMWYAYKGDKYRIGYAESHDSVNWTRKDELFSMPLSSDGFDSDMSEYAAIIKHKSRYYMLFNGNNYGFHGIGLAELI